MKRFIAAIVPLGLALIASSSDARTFTFPQTVCQPVLGSAGCIEYDNYGAHNVCGGTATVECPLSLSYPTSGSFNVTSSAYFAYDRNTTSNVSCTLQRTDFSGAVLFSTTVSTSGGGPGTGLQTGTFTVSQSINGYWRMRCDIPGVQSGWVSHVSNLYMISSE